MGIQGMLNINDAPEKAKRIFARLVNDFEEQEINPTPLNYYVWYEFLKGDNPQFRSEMESILQDPFGYNDRAGKRLYQEYLQEEMEATGEFDRAFRRLLNLMIQKMNLWSDKLEEHTQQLDDCAHSLANPDIDANELKKITHTVISTAQSMNESNRLFQQEMMLSSDEIKHLRQELLEAQTAALTDELTEIGNRKAFNNALQETIINFNEGSDLHGFCLIFTDIDHFKRFNDSYGHLVGDSVLRYFANIMKKNQKRHETICRYGGEEFAIIMPNASLEEARERAEQIRSGIESAVLKRKDSSEPLRTITASFGISCFHNENDSAEELITRADKALYEAKRQGRNCIVDENEMGRPSIAP
ncbi:GGDEF domain-containing protein [Thiomicrorhabdus sp. zzn3]|uniref:GGDEF domain-containing protein n=1 Tax=Thiomicrorhabdus sp. zzn3 TaxID=3039775 RepID=UPI002436ED8F|nr:GGDEF domain-containing protein [Thiomicrorhabdus sp. zzn3]MDG6778951.1 GGDEF domain-containing protein [Thiomicrorhabdus sp. zzn3]